MADRLRRLVHDLRFKNAIQVTGSFGVAEWKEGDTAEDLIQRADEKL